MQHVFRMLCDRSTPHQPARTTQLQYSHAAGATSASRASWPRLTVPQGNGCLQQSATSKTAAMQGLPAASCTKRRSQQGAAPEAGATARESSCVQQMLTRMAATRLALPGAAAAVQGMINIQPGCMPGARGPLPSRKLLGSCSKQLLLNASVWMPASERMHRCAAPSRCLVGAS